MQQWRRRLSPTSLARPAFAGALALLLAACGQNLPKADALEAQSDIAMSAQLYPVAANLMDQAIKYDSNEPRRWVKLGRAQRSAGMPALAAMSFQRALDLDPANIESLQNLSILEVRAGRYDEAKTYVEPLMALSPDDVAGLIAKGAIALYQQQWQQGLDYAEQLIKIAPQSTGGYMLKAHVLDGMGRPNAAAKVLAQQAIFNPDDSELSLTLLNLYKKTGNVQGVRDTSVNLARLMPDDPRYKMESARALFARGDRAQSDAIIAELIKRYRYLPDLMASIGHFWQATLPPDAAVAKIVDLSGRGNGHTRAALADMLIDTGHAPLVVTLLAPLGNGPATADNAEALATYSKALLLTGKPDQAKAVADKVLTFDPNIGEALIVRATVALARKRFADALTDAQLAASIDDRDADALTLVPRIYAAMGNPVLAASAWGDASSHLPDSIDILTQRINWLLATKQPDTAEGLAANFALGHAGQNAAWELYRVSCLANNHSLCADEAAREIRDLAKKHG